ncbi:hypothetical protein V1Y59_16015 [Gordonia sp. PKS22-38]|uniref:YceI-like domain-containing protein n=1 Tax=Gordonia prachuapensis TaxID=3115651 RepID=A0ABU7MWA6_9ACTN|nr:hypothetical protein [Gordonia sp. PKS22-38]
MARRAHPLDLRVVDTADGHEVATETTIRQTDFDIKPFSLMMGTLKVVDEVVVAITVRVPHQR